MCKGSQNVIVSLEKKELSQKPNLCLWGAWKFPQRNCCSEKMARIIATKIQWPEVMQIPGVGVLLYVGHIGMNFCSPKEYGFSIEPLLQNNHKIFSFL